jgi:hypothetical protein
MRSIPFHRRVFPFIYDIKRFKPLRQQLIEARESEFAFRIVEADDVTTVDTTSVKAEDLDVMFEVAGVQRSLPYTSLSVYVLARSKTVNLVVAPPIIRPFAMLLIPLVIAAGLFAWSLESDNLSAGARDATRIVAVVLAIAAYVGIFVVQYAAAASIRRQSLRATESTTPLIRELSRAEGVDDYFSKLIQINLKNMEQYYTMVGTQTDKSYRLTRSAAIIGFAVLIAGVIIGLVQQSAKGVPAATMAGGAVIQFISAIFFYIYNRTIRQLDVYHERLVSVQDTMLALKVAQVITNPEKKDSTMSELTRALTGKLALRTSAESANERERTA